jgi:large subunit ribosomal protein L19
MYNPLVQYITVLKLEKRLDENLMFLRDCPKEYSTFPFDMLPELRNPEDPVPVNPLVVSFALI